MSQERVYRVGVPMKIWMEFRVPATSAEEAVRKLDAWDSDYDPWQPQEIEETADWDEIEHWEVDGRKVVDEPWYQGIQEVQR